MPVMTLTLAEECVRRIKAKATELGAEMAIAVVDDAGKLVLYARMMQRSGGFGDKLAVAKAKTAVAYRRTTKESLERYANYPGNNYIVTMSAMCPAEFCVVPGGAPLIIEGQLVGGVGVSGSTPANDHQCVTEALEGITLQG
jgi:uncharacterized protein GlcG (DUF336 family)